MKEILVLTVNWIRLSAHNLPGVIEGDDLEMQQALYLKNSLSLPMHAGLSGNGP